MLESIENIAVVGGGIGGLSSAIFLARLGYRITVFEKADSPGPVGAGFLLQPPGQAVLEELGVLNEITKSAVPIHGLKSETLSGQKLLDLHYCHLQGVQRHGLGIQRSNIYDALFKLSSSFENIEFRWANTVKKCTTQGLEALVHTDEEIIPFDLCLISSGSNSALLDGAFLGRVRRPYRWGCFWATMDLPAEFDPGWLHQRCQGSERMMGILPVLADSGRYKAALYWSVKGSDLLKMDDEKFLAVKNEMMRFWPEASSSITPLTLAEFISASYNDVWTPKPINNRLVAIGDASHATSPQLGQGCTMALLDAWLLAKCLDNNEELNASLQKWWGLRRKQLSYVRQLSRFLTPLYQSEHKLPGLFRDWLMAPMGKISFLYKLQLKTLASEVFLDMD